MALRHAAIAYDLPSSSESNATIFSKAEKYFRRAWLHTCQAPRSVGTDSQKFAIPSQDKAAYWQEVAEKFTPSAIAVIKDHWCKFLQAPHLFALATDEQFGASIVAPVVLHLVFADSRDFARVLRIAFEAETSLYSVDANAFTASSSSCLFVIAVFASVSTAVVLASSVSFRLHLDGWRDAFCPTVPYGFVLKKEGPTF